jgi:hemerythrin
MAKDESSGPALIIWTPQFSVKSAQMDKQHQAVIGMINQLFKAFVFRKERSQAGEVLKALADYTLTHFAAEEAMLQRLGYNDFLRHKNLHDAMAAKTRLFSDTFSAADEEAVLELMDILKKWWTGHILKEDRKYAALLKLCAEARANRRKP